MTEASIREHSVATSPGLDAPGEEATFVVPIRVRTTPLGTLSSTTRMLILLLSLILTLALWKGAQAIPSLLG